MRKLFAVAFLAVVLAASYVACPLLTAWSIREAIRSGDAAYLARKIEWDSVRGTLRTSLTDTALAAPTAEGAASNAPPAKPGLQRRFKAYVGARAVDKFVASYVTPEGLPHLFAYRRMYREHVSGETDEAKTLAWPQRFAGFWSRLKRAEFHDPMKLEIEMADRHDPSRHYIGLLQLRGLEWKLTELRVRVLGGV